MSHSSNGNLGGKYFCIIWAVIQTACVFGIWIADEKNIKWPKEVTGIIAPIFIFIGYVPQIYEIIPVDFSGGIFSTLSLAACYIVIFMMDLIIIVLYYYFNWLRKKSLISDHNIEQGDDYNNEQVNIHIIELGDDHNIEQENDH
ncbi:5608_t:CDS:2, partial [Gigaspora rosea]